MLHKVEYKKKLNICGIFNKESCEAQELETSANFLDLANTSYKIV